MKKITAIVILLFSTSMLFAQSPVGENGKQLNFGTGLSSFGLPLYVGMDFGVHPDITAGLNFSFRQQSGSGYRNNVTG
jgi:outer membrane immunogenic protein